MSTPALLTAFLTMDARRVGYRGLLTSIRGNSIKRDPRRDGSVGAAAALQSSVVTDRWQWGIFGRHWLELTTQVSLIDFGIMFKLIVGGDVKVG